MTSDDVAAAWDAEAAVFDDEPHHALEEPEMRGAWADVLRTALPPAPCTVADLGCGTGSLSVLLAELGYDVTGVDLSAEMVARARIKADRFGATVRFTVGDAADPPIDPVDVVLTRHVAWAVPDLDVAIRRWAELLRPDGRLVLVEGRWWNGSGLDSGSLAAAVSHHLPNVTVHPLDDPVLWGYPLRDSRYLLLARAGS